MSSLSLRRAWIEIAQDAPDGLPRSGSLSLRRAWIEIVLVPLSDRVIDSRSPYGERGLKSRVYVAFRRWYASLSLRRAWIEIQQKTKTNPKKEESLSLRRAWIEIRQR